MQCLPHFLTQKKNLGLVQVQDLELFPLNTPVHISKCQKHVETVAVQVGIETGQVGSVTLQGGTDVVFEFGQTDSGIDVGTDVVFEFGQIRQVKPTQVKAVVLVGSCPYPCLPLVIAPHEDKAE